VGKLWRALDWKMLLYCVTIWNILRSFGIIYGCWVEFAAIWCIFPRFGMFGPRKIWQPCTTLLSVQSLSRFL
jgi:hypothetical protein